MYNSPDILANCSERKNQYSLDARKHDNRPRNHFNAVLGLLYRS